MPFVIQWIDECEGPEQVLTVPTPAGKLALTIRQDVITGTDWLLDEELAQSGDHPLSKAFERYWQNPDHPVAVKLLKQGSRYRNQVWAELCRIPFGATASYSALARNIGSSARAVGNACRDNPYALIIPCHRVVSVSGIGGYCGHRDGGWMMIKTRLLQFEAGQTR